jgi:hypothetical protein
LKETSYLTDAAIIAHSAGIATTIGNYLLDAIAPPVPNDFISVIYIGRQQPMMQFPSEKLPCRRRVNRRENKIMGDKSPKSNQKKSSQKQAKASSASQKKGAAAAAKSAAKKK